jgi:hypothetical protein
LPEAKLHAQYKPETLRGLERGGGYIVASTFPFLLFRVVGVFVVPRFLFQGQIVHFCLLHLQNFVLLFMVYTDGGWFKSALSFQKVQIGGTYEKTVGCYAGARRGVFGMYRM